MLSPFEYVYGGVNPLTPIDLLLIPSELRLGHDVEVRAREMKRLHKQIRGHRQK